MRIHRVVRMGSVVLSMVFLIFYTTPNADAHSDLSIMVAEIDTAARTCPELCPELRKSVLKAYSKWNKANHKNLTRIRNIPMYRLALEYIENDKVPYLKNLKTQPCVNCQSLLWKLGKEVDWKELLRDYFLKKESEVDKGSEIERDSKIIGGQPRSLPAAEVVNIVNSWPKGAHFGISGLAFYNNYLYVTTNVGLIELREGKPHTLYIWYDKHNVVSGLWKDINRNSLWLQREDDGYLVRLDDHGWHLIELPVPPKGYYNLEGITYFSNLKIFRLVSAGHVWSLTESGDWQIEPQPPAGDKSRTVGFASLDSCNIYIVKIGVCSTPPCEYAAYWYESGSWGPPLPLQIYHFRDVIATSEGVFVRGEKGDLLRVEQNKVTPVKIPAPCEAISRTSQGKLIACFRGVGIFVLDKNWIKLFDYPYPSSEGEHWAYLAENNGIVAFATAAVPQLKRKGNKEEWYYTGTDALWVSEGNRLVRVNIL